MSKLEFEMKRLKEINETKNREIEDLQMRNQRIQNQLD